MRHAAAVAAAIAVLASGCAHSPSAGVGGHPWLAGYYAVSERDLMPPGEIEWSAMTHIVVARVVPKADGSLDTTFDYDAKNGPALARDIVRRAHAHNVTPLLMVGGDGEHDGWVAASRHRDGLVGNLVAAMREYGFDGLDLDWEPIQDADRSSLSALVSDLRAAARSAILTMPVSWVTLTAPIVPPFYAKVAKKLDRLNVMSYGMAGAWQGWKSWHSSALDGATSTTPSSIILTVNAFLEAGVPPGKLGLGVGFFGTCWRGSVSGPRQTVGSSQVVAADHVMSYENIISRYYAAGAYHYDDTAKASYLGWSAPYGSQRCTYVSYEDQRSIAAKGAYARVEHLGGAIVWTINQGHDRDSPAGTRDALLAGAKSAFGA